MEGKPLFDYEAKETDTSSNTLKKKEGKKLFDYEAKTEKKEDEKNMEGMVLKVLQIILSIIMAAFHI